MQILDSIARTLGRIATADTRKRSWTPSFDYAIPSILMLAVTCLGFSSANILADDPPAVDQIAQRAINAQNAGEFDIAASQWEELIAGYPKSSQIGVAFYQAGFCYVQTGQFAKAADRLSQSIGKLNAADKNSMAQAHLFLGFSQAKLGRELLGENRQEAEQWLTTATQTFVKLTKNFPDFDDIDQALFFQGDAFEALGRLDDAAKSYSEMLKLEKPEFELDGQFALGFIKGQQGQFDRALELYQQFEASAEGRKHPSFNEVRFRAGEALRQLARSAANLGDKQQETALLKRAAGRFEAVYQSKDKNWADQARFQQADTLQRLGDFAESGRVFQSVMEFESSELVDRARVYAGRDFLRAGDANSASQFLEKAVSVPSPYAAEAAHWLAQLYLRSKQNDKAFALAKEWVTKAEEDSVKIPLMLDLADAAYASANRRNEARDLYLTIVNNHPNDRLAPTALYNAAYAAMETGKFDDAVELTSQFRDKYSDSDYLPDVLEVEADSFLLAEKPDSAATTFGELLEKYEGHPKSSLWKLRIGLSQYLQKQYDTSIASLSPIVQSLTDPAQKAEALHWIGSSHYQLGQYPKAINNLETSLTTNNTWRRADETLLTLSRSFYAADNPTEAKRTTQLLIENFPKSPLIGEANYRMGEFEYQAANYRQALEYYTSVVQNSGQSSFAPFAMYGIGWSQLQLNQPKIAIDSFSKLIEVFPKHPLATDVLIGRASAYRQQGKLDKAIADAQSYLDAPGDGTKKEEATFELGLAHIEKSDWPQVVKAFSSLLETAPQSKLADRYHYELAWAHKSNKDSAACLKHFQAVANEHPDSPLAAESNFHVAQDAYDNKDYALAVKRFQLCVDKSDVSNLTDPKEIASVKKIKEKSLYKLAWSHFKNKDFDKSQRAFRAQLDEFPKGQLSADAMFMVSESLYENNKFKEAAQQYWVAKPIMEDSETSVSPNYKILTFLHGAQAANQAKEHQRAIEFVDALFKLAKAQDVSDNIQQDAQMELGDAYRALKDGGKAMAAYRKSSLHPGETGARSMFMMGELLFDEKNFSEAINKFKLVGFGYGGTESKPKVKHWQAFATYETGRCNLLLAASENTEPAKKKYLSEAKKHFEKVVNNFPDDKLVSEATRQLQKLKAAE